MHLCGGMNHNGTNGQLIVKLIRLINTANLSGLKSEYAKWGQVYHNKTDQYGYHKCSRRVYM